MSSLDFMWLELTNQCNLSCNHCYADSGPEAGDQDILTLDDYCRLLDEGFDAGCRHVQFIGGEPTLFADLPFLIGHARKRGFSGIAVFSNLIRLSEAQITSFRVHDVSVSTSVYGPTADVHELITLRQGSFDRTMKNISRLVNSGVHVRAGFIETDLNVGAFGATDRFLRGLGLTEIGFDGVREFGRGKAGDSSILDSLCGECAGKTLAVSSAGLASPCVLSRDWSFGSVLETPLSDLLASSRLAELRSEIRAATSRKSDMSNCYPDHSNPNCVPNAPCGPDAVCGPKCQPIFLS